MLKHFRRGIITKILLTVISACTYIMIASSALRMDMYVSEFNLTRQRVKVFWALATLAIIFIFVLKYKDENFIKKYGISDLSFRHLNLSKIMARRYIEN